MNADERYLHDIVIALLSKDEIANVNRLDAAPSLSDADECLDLEQLGQGIQRGPGPARPIFRVLPRKAIHETTWASILARLSDRKPPAV